MATAAASIRRCGEGSPPPPLPWRWSNGEDVISLWKRPCYVQCACLQIQKFQCMNYFSVVVAAELEQETLLI